MKTYSNRFASMEQQPCGGWIVFSEVSGLALDSNGMMCDGETAPHIHATYQSARETMIVLTDRYKSISKGGRA
jgi:hypothetical protein